MTVSVKISCHNLEEIKLSDGDGDSDADGGGDGHGFVVI